MIKVLHSNQPVIETSSVSHGVRVEGGSLQSITFPWEQGVNIFEQHVTAARKFADKYDITGTWTSGNTLTGFIFVQTGGPHETSTQD